MDVLVVSRCPSWPLHHGDRLILYHVARGLAARGHRLDLIALHPPDEPRPDRSAATAPFRWMAAVPDRPRSPLQYLGRLARPFPGSADRCWNPPMWEAVRRRLAERRYDLVHFFGGVAVYEYRRLAGRLPTIVVPYESYALFLERARAASGRALERVALRAKLAVARRYERVMYAGFHRVVLVSDRDEACLRALAPRLPTVVIPNGVEPPPFRPAPGVRRRPWLVFVGNYAYAPNVAGATALVTEVLPRVRAAVPEARAVLVGADPTSAVTSLAGGTVEVTGWVPDVRPFLAEATCLVAFLTQGAGIRNKILEAMAMGTPVVATPLACEGIEVTAGEHVLLGRDGVELAAAAVRLFGDEALRARLGEAGRELVRRRYTWDEVAVRYERLYGAVVSECAAR